MPVLFFYLSNNQEYAKKTRNRPNLQIQVIPIETSYLNNDQYQQQELLEVDFYRNPDGKS
jgi:hypothetical protein